MTILIVEDDANLRRGLAELLALEGYETATAANGAAALEAYSDVSPDFCIIDVGLPDLDGFEVCKALRARNGALPILFLTARTEEIDRLRGFGAGADDYVGKPFSAGELVARIRAITRRHSGAAPRDMDQAPFSLLDLHVEPKAMRAFRGDEVIDLTRRELDLLRLFSERPGQAIGRDDLYNHGWGRDHFANSRSLDQFMSTLRRKIERDPGSPEIIVTVHGIGYRFDP